MDVLTPDQRRRNMQAIKNKGTKDEVLLAKALWNRGYRYRKNNPKVYGKPDLTITRYRLAIFVDSEFFHGKDWNKEKYRIKTNRKFWWTKIERNIERDAIVNKTLVETGWKVLRFWSSEIRKNLANCVTLIEKEAKNGN